MVSVCAYLQHLVLKIAAAVLDVDRAAAVHEERCRLPAACALRIDGDGTGILDVDFGILADCRDSRRADIRHSLDREVFAI